MIILDDKTKKFLIDLYQQKNIGLEGNITRFLDVSNDEEFKKYVDECIGKDKEGRKKRLEITKQIQIQKTK